MNVMVRNTNHSRQNINSNHYTPLIKCLSECQQGIELIVRGVNAGRGAKRRLAHLGIVPGVKIKKKNLCSKDKL